MYRLFIITLGVFVLCSGSYGKSVIGVRGGVNIGDRRIEPDHGADTQTRTGGIFGVTIQGSLNSNETVFLQAAATYTDRGWFEDTQYFLYDVNTEFIVPEVAFGPALILCARGKHAKPFLELGVETAVVIRRLAKADYLGSTFEGEITDYSKSNISLNLGVGLGFPVKHDEVQAEIRYSLGLKNMLDTETDATLKTTGIQLLFGYFFTIKR